LLPWQLAIENGKFDSIMCNAQGPNDVGVKFGHSSPDMHRSLALEFESCLTGGSRITSGILHPRPFMHKQKLFETTTCELS